MRAETSLRPGAVRLLWMSPAIVAAIPDVEKKSVLLQRRRAEHRVLVADDLLDVANEALVRRGGRGSVVMHHRAVTFPMDDERVEQHRGRDFGRRVDESVVVL